MAPRELGTDKVVGGVGRPDETVVDLSKLSKSRRIVKSQKTSKTISLEEPSFLTSDTRLAFTKMGSRHTNSRWRTTGHCWKRIGGAT